MPDATTKFLPLSFGQAGHSGQIAPGSVVYMAHAVPMLVVAVAEEGTHFAPLSGDDAFVLTRAHYYDRPCYVLADWRIEIDPTSLVDGEVPEVGLGKVYRSAGETGLAVTYAGLSRPFRVTAVGSLSDLPIGSDRLVFSRWRIVTGPEDRPFVIAASP